MHDLACENPVFSSAETKGLISGVDGINDLSVIRPSTFAFKTQADSLLFAAVLLLLLQPIQIEEVDPVFQIGGLIATPSVLT